MSLLVGRFLFSFFGGVVRSPVLVFMINSTLLGSRCLSFPDNDPPSNSLHAHTPTDRSTNQWLNSIRSTTQSNPPHHHPPQNSPLSPPLSQKATPPPTTRNKDRQARPPDPYGRKGRFRKKPQPSSRVVRCKGENNEAGRSRGGLVLHIYVERQDERAFRGGREKGGGRHGLWVQPQANFPAPQLCAAAIAKQPTHSLSLSGLN